MQWGQEPSQALATAPPPEPTEEEAAPAPLAPAMPFAVEFVTLPAPEGPRSARRSHSTRSARVPALGQSGSAKASRPSPKRPPTAFREPLQITRETSAPTGLLQGPDKASKQAGDAGFSLGMRRGQIPSFDGRQGSLLDDAIASSATAPPTAAPGTRADLIYTEARIGLDSQSTRVTRWRDAPGGSMEAVGEPFTARIEADGRIRFEDHDNMSAKIPRWKGIPLPMVVGSFDVTDAAMQAFGDVLYPYRKLKAMDQTREYRAAMAVRARGESLQGALTGFHRDLAKVWQNGALSAKERRAIIFALWDECAEEGPDEVVETAASIRAMIVSFVVRELPKGSADAYGSDELSSLNAERQSARAFAPYAE